MREPILKAEAGMGTLRRLLKALPKGEQMLVERKSPNRWLWTGVRESVTVFFEDLETVKK